MKSTGAIRAVCLFLPVFACLAAWAWRSPARRLATGALLATAWNLATLPLLHLLSRRFGWWSYAAEGGLFLRFPLDLYIGWAILWGALPALLFPALSLAAVAGLAAAVDLLAMPACAPVVELGRNWVSGELTGIFVCLIPALCLSRWTTHDTRLRGRTVLQGICFVLLTFFVLPAAAVEASGRSLGRLPFSSVSELLLMVQVLVFLAVPGLVAVQEFVERGEGTPLPYDPPRHLVTSGIYSYVANPMQLSSTLVLLGIGWLLRQPWILAGGALGILYGIGLAQWHEHVQLQRRFGQEWGRYRAAVRWWIPRWRPYVQEVGVLYVAETCGPCSDVGRWFRRRHPSGLEVMAAERHPSRDLDRISYETANGFRAEGVAAVGRALEHIHLGWAMIGWTIRLPLVRPFLRILMDSVGAGPRLVPRDGSDGTGTLSP